MKEMELKDLIEINDEVVGDGLILMEDGVEKYLILKAANNQSSYQYEDDNSKVKVISNIPEELSESEYQELLRALVDALEDKLKPIKPEDMN